MTVAVADGSSLGCADPDAGGDLALELDHALGGGLNAARRLSRIVAANVSRIENLSYRYRPTIENRIDSVWSTVLKKRALAS